MTPIFRFKLSSPNQGELEISEPIGWKQAKIILERSRKYHSLVETFQGEFVFYGNNGNGLNGGIDFIREEIAIAGKNCRIFIDIDLSFDGGYNFQDLFLGRLDVSLKKETRGARANKMMVPIIPGGAWTTFFNNQKTDVDIRSLLDKYGNDVDPVDSISLRMSSQLINKVSNFDGHSGDIDTLQPAAVRTTANITLSGHQTIDGVATTENMRVLVMNQSTAANNGVYSASSGSWSRASDANTGAELELAIINVTGGTLHAGKTYKQYTTPVTIGVSSINWSQYNYVDDYLLYSSDTEVPVETHMIFYTVATLDPDRKEINATYTLPFIATEDVSEIFETIEPIDEDGVLTISGDADFSMKFTGTAQTSAIIQSHEWRVRLYTQLNDDAPIEQSNFIFSDAVPVTYPIGFNLFANQTYNVFRGDRVKVYIRYEIWTDFDTNSGVWEERYYWGGITRENIQFEFKSTLPATTSDGFFIHDVGGGVLDRISGEKDLFRAPVLGSASTKYHAYGAAGEHWKYGNFRGLQIRGYSLTEKPYFTNWDKWWNGLDPILCLGMGVEMYEGQEKFVVKSRADFYDKSSSSVQFTNVNLIENVYDTSYIWKQIRIGYQKWQAEDLGGIDDPQTKRAYVTQFEIFGDDLDIFSEMIAASLAIEITRRKTREKSADYKFDEDVFIIALNDDGIYSPELSENFTTITNLNDGDTRYNLRLTCARNFLRFLDWLSSCLHEYPSDSFKFASGEGNFDMTSTLADGSPENFNGANLSEKQNIPVSETPLLITEFAQFEHYLAWEHYLTIRENKDLAVDISFSEGDFEQHFIDRVALTLASGNLEFKGWRCP